MTGTNFSDWYRQDEGTVYTELAVNGLVTSSTQNVFWLLEEGTFDNGVLLRAGTVISGFDYFVKSLGSAVVDTSSIAATVGEYQKFAFTIKENDFAFTSTDNAIVIEDTAGAQPIITKLLLEATNTTYKKLTYYPKRLTNAQLQAVTEE